ncbi:unnamed protein product [Tuber melanosporum]|uniref:(Perigord truffle) hypothetical protein n=1 Tax=Tuber melanosporum (strain Mel28) TaxID=656061 RepID=D5GE00_TUBMM|nr:uncharacterized protein GSTUM_00001155001 [Tuber melanosporum]CAZ82743.1 unnamed protein product [Tuber melanosporum]
MALPIAATESTITTKNLTRLLSRLDSKLASRKAAPLSTVDRAKFAANLEYARQLLLSLESEPSLIRNASTRQSVLSGLGVQKQAIRRLNEQLLVMAAEGEEEGGGSTDDDSDGEEEEEVKEVSALPAQVNGGERPQQSESIPAPATTTTSTLRNRFQQPTTTPTNHHQREQLFPPRPDPTAAATDTNTDTEKHLDHQRAEQEHITADMLSLAQALKQSSLRFGSELENEKVLLDMAREGLDKNALGIEGTGMKLKALRQDESVGFLWSILYPVIIVGLAFMVLFVLFFAPKLRWW